MRNIFPNIETAIIFLVIISASLWGIKSCRAKNANTIVSTVPTTTTALPNFRDTTTSLATPTSPASSTLPALRRVNVPKAPVKIQNSNDLSSTDPNSSISNTTLQPAVTSPNVPASYNTNVVRGKGLTPATPQSQGQSQPSVVFSNNSPLYVLIAGLNVRTTPNLKGRSLGKLHLNDIVYFMNEKSDDVTTVHLADGTEVSAPWFKIKTKRGTEGWVHGSGVDFYKRSPKKNF